MVHSSSSCTRSILLVHVLGVSKMYQPKYKVLHWKVPLSEINALLSLKILDKANYLTGNLFVVLTIYLSKRKSFSLDLWYRVCDPLVYLKLYVWKICYYDFACERKFIRHCINQNQPPNLRLKAEIKSTPLILQTENEKSKRKVPLSEINALLSLKILDKANYLTGN